VGYSEERYQGIVKDYTRLAKALDLTNVVYLPVSALGGDNIVERSDKTPWYTGKTLLEHLETVEIAEDVNLRDPRFQVQYVIRPKSDELHDYRGYAGQIQSGVYRKGDRVTVLPSGLQSTISAIEVHQQEVDEAVAGQPAVLHLRDDIDISRGASIVKTTQLPTVSQDIEATLCLTDSAPIFAGSKLLLQHNSQVVKAIVKEIYYKLDVNTYEKIRNPPSPGINDLIYVRLRTAVPLVYDPYKNNRRTGAFILINENTCQTVAAGMIQPLESDFVI
jgi:sulfate adenylyltransferase subunit 1